MPLARSDGEDEISWFGLPVVASQDLSFKGENRAVPIGQKLEAPSSGLVEKKVQSSSKPEPVAASRKHRKWRQLLAR